VANTSGWRIKGDGNAEFNDVTVRGSVFVTGGDAATQTYADNAAASALSDAEDYADLEAESARNAARNNIAQQLGYTDYNTMVSTVGTDGTIIASGFIRTTLLDVDDIFATNATITSTLTMGTGGIISNSANDYSLSSAGIRINAGTAGNVTAKQYQIRGSYGGNANAVIGYLEGLVNLGGTLGQVRLYGETNLFVGAGTQSNAIEVTQTKTTVAGSNQNVVYLGSNIGLYASRFRFDADNSTIDAISFNDYDILPRRAMDNRYISAIATTTPQNWSNQVDITSSGNLQWRNNSGPRIFDGSPGTYYAQILYTSGGSSNRNAIIPVLTGNRTFAFIDQAQTFTANQTFGHDRLKVQNTGANGAATLRYGTASADRTYTFAGANGTVWTNGNLGLSVSAGAVTPDTTLEIEFNGNRYTFSAQLQP
jgi:hypothetical protein